MEITINSEKYINADAPVLTKEILDWLYLNLWKTRISEILYKLDAIKIIANTAYNGSNKIHFYITFVGRFNTDKEIVKESHLEYYISSPNNEERTFYGKKKRWHWLIDMKNANVDCGEETKDAVLKYAIKKFVHKRKDKRLRKKKAKAERYKQYLRLKAEFENNLK